MSQKLPIDGFKLHLNLIKISYKTTLKIVKKDIFSKFMFNILKNYVTLTMTFHFYLEE